MNMIILIASDINGCFFDIVTSMLIYYTLFVNLSIGDAGNLVIPKDEYVIVV